MYYSTIIIINADFYFYLPLEISSSSSYEKFASEVPFNIATNIVKSPLKSLSNRSIVSYSDSGVILIAEDNLFIRTMLFRALSKFKFEL